MCASVHVTGARTDFYDPAVVLLEKIREDAEAEAMTSEGRRLDPRGVRAAAPDTVGMGHSTGREAFWKLALRRVRSIVGQERYVARWRAAHVPAGYFFAFPSRVLLVTHRHSIGWRHVVVPPEGIDARRRRP